MRGQDARDPLPNFQPMIARKPKVKFTIVSIWNSIVWHTTLDTHQLELTESIANSSGKKISQINIT